MKLSGLDEGVTVRIDMEDARGVRTVYENFHQPEETVVLPVRGTGTEVTFRIYYNDEMVKDSTLAEIATSPRIGVAYAGEWAERPWRFYLPTSPHISVRPRK